MAETTAITVSDSLADGVTAAAEWMAAGELEPEHFTNPGADAWGDEGCNIGDAATIAFQGSKHWQATTGQCYFEARADGTLVRVGADWEDGHWDAFLHGFDNEANRLAAERGWEVANG